MLAQLESRLPVGHQWRYEPKLDGFRGLLWRRTSGQVQLLSRRRRAELEQLLDGLHPSLQLVDQTADIRLAQDWLTLPTVEGVVAKLNSAPFGCVDSRRAPCRM
jgi:ATP-dependent DNA ligase